MMIVQWLKPKVGGDLFNRYATLVEITENQHIFHKRPRIQSAIYSPANLERYDTIMICPVPDPEFMFRTCASSPWRQGKSSLKPTLKPQTTPGLHFQLNLNFAALGRREAYNFWIQGLLILHSGQNDFALIHYREQKIHMCLVNSSLGLLDKAIMTNQMV